MRPNSTKKDQQVRTVQRVPSISGGHRLQWDGRSMPARMLAVLALAFGLLAENEGRGQSASTPLVVQGKGLPDLPNAEGVAGAFCGLINQDLIVAGGANFPDGRPWEGGQKKWHSAIYRLRDDSQSWERAGELPHALAYGVALTLPDGLVCLGGSDSQRHYAQCFLLRQQGATLERVDLPDLPQPLANMAGAIVGNRILVAGGSTEPGERGASPEVYALDLGTGDRRWKDLRWQTLEPLPTGGRLLPNSAALGNRFYVFGGAALVKRGDGVTREYLRDAWTWQEKEGWSRIADLPYPLLASPSPSPVIGPNHFLVLGGDDGSRFGFQPAAEHPGFKSELLTYHALTDTWTTAGKLDEGVVTTGVVVREGKILVPSGEVRPGIRTARVASLELRPHQPNFGTVNYLVLGGYLIVVFVIGLATAGKVGTTLEFFRAGQQIPWWAAGLSIFATMLSSITFMSIPAQGYSVGWNLFLGSIYVVLTPIVVWVFLPFYRRLDVTTAYEYLERRFNVGVRLFASLQFMLFQLGRIAVVLFLPSLALATVAGIDLQLSIVAVGLLCVVYTMFGGMRSVIWTDVTQAVILMGGAIGSLVALVSRIPGGVAEATRTARAHYRFFETLSWEWTTDGTVVTAWAIILGSLFSNLFSYTASQDVVQRYLTTRDERAAGRAIWTNALLAPLAQAIFFAIGTGLFVFYSKFPGRLHPSIANDGIFPYFVVTELPVGVAGLVVAAVFAASQSTISSSLNSIATAFVTDFYSRWSPQASDRNSLRVAQGMTLLVGIVGIVLAIMLARLGNLRSLWETFMAVLGLFGGSVAGLFVLGIFTRRCHGVAAMCGAVFSMLLVLTLFWYNVTFWWYSVGGVLGCVVGGYLVSWIVPGRSHFQNLCWWSLPEPRQQDHCSR